MIRYRLKKGFAILTLLGGCCFIVISGSLAKPIAVDQTSDTARTYQLREVVVTATRTPLSPIHSPLAVDVISRFQLTTQNGNSLASALSGSTGILIKDYGGLSALKTLSLRGTGAEHRLILLDGVRYNSLQTGIVDIGMVPMESTERIEIVRGGNSAMYGADALGGVVNVTTLSPPSISGAEVAASFGSFGYNRYAVQAHAQLFEGLQFLLGGSEEKSDGDFLFMDARQSPTVFQRRANADLFTKRLYGKIRWKMMENMASQVFVSHYTTARGAPGPLVGSSQGTARQNDQVLDILGSVTHEGSSSWRYQVSSGFQSAFERYYDEQGVQSVDNYYKTAMMNIVADVQHSVSDDVLGIGGFDAGYAVADGNALSSKRRRAHAGTFATGEMAIHPESFFFERVALYPSLRYDWYSDLAGAWSPRIALNFVTPPSSLLFLTDAFVALRSSFGKNFRAPTFNELYYQGGGGAGNPELLPERSTSFDAGISFAYFLGVPHSFDVTYFNIDTENRILWLPTSSSFIWTPRNLGRVQSTGLELEYRLLFNDNIRLQCNYTLTNSLKKFQSSQGDPGLNKQLIYVPLDMGNVSLTVNVPVEDSFFKKFGLHFAFHYVGVRYTTEDNSEYLDPYYVLDGNFMTEAMIVGVTAKMKFEANNMTGVSYQILQGYPTPLRNYQLTFSIVK